MSQIQTDEQEPITFTDEQTEAIRQGFAGLEAGKKGIPLDDARAMAKKRAQEWLNKTTVHSAPA